MTPNKDDFNEIKRELIEGVLRIESFIEDGEKQRIDIQKTLRDINTKLNGDYIIYPPIIGHEQRLINLEKVENDRIKNKEGLIKLATGSITIAVGGAVIWIFNVLKDAFTKGGH